jgi:hypothetical protein
MKITYELDEKDYIKFNKYNMFVKNKKSFYSVLLLFIVVAIILSPHSPQKWVSAILFSWTAYTLAIIWLIYSSAKQLYKTDRDFFGCHVATIKDEGFVVRNNNGEHSVNWESIREIIVSEKYIYIFCGGNNTFIIPDTAFKGSKELWEKFLQQLGYHKYYKNVMPRTAQ